MELLDLIKESGVVRVHPDKLKPNTWNPNQMDEKTWNALGQSIRRYGIHLQPIVVRERGDKYQIIDGQHRWNWACEMGLDEVSIVVTDATDADAKKLTQILNRTRGTDDPAKLKELLDSLLIDLSPEEVIDGMAIANTKELDELLAELEEEIDEEYGRDDSDNDEGLNYQLGDENLDESEKKTLNDKFLVPPFSVLDARQGYWQARKRMWLDLGIQSELGRGGDNMEYNPDGSSTQSQEDR